MNRQPMLAKIHIARKELALDIDAYRAVLQRAAGKASAADCSDGELDRVLDEMKRLGWQPKAGAVKKSDKPYIRKIFAIWGDLGRRGAIENASRQALAAFVKRQTGIDNPEWLSIEDAARVTEALKAMQRRAGGE
jgi:phage gp16-like protein